MPERSVHRSDGSPSESGTYTAAARVAAVADASQLAVWLAVPASLERAKGAVSLAEET